MSIQAKKCRRANKNLHMLLAITYHTLMTTLHLLTPSFGRREAPNSTSFSPHQTVKDELCSTCSTVKVLQTSLLPNPYNRLNNLPCFSRYRVSKQNVILEMVKTGWTGRTGQSVIDPFGPLFHFLCYILFTNPVLRARHNLPYSWARVVDPFPCSRPPRTSQSIVDGRSATMDGNVEACEAAHHILWH